MPRALPRRQSGLIHLQRCLLGPGPRAQVLHSSEGPGWRHAPPTSVRAISHAALGLRLLCLSRVFTTYPHCPGPVSPAQTGPLLPGPHAVHGSTGSFAHSLRGWRILKATAQPGSHAALPDSIRTAFRQAGGRPGASPGTAGPMGAGSQGQIADSTQAWRVRPTTGCIACVCP